MSPKNVQFPDKVSTNATGYRLIPELKRKKDYQFILKITFS